MKPRPSRQQLLDRMIKPKPTPKPLKVLEPQEPQDQLAAWVEVGLTRHPLQCYRYTIYDMIRS